MSNVRYCSGCGVKLQDENILNIGYTTNINNELCMRCFRLQNYGEYESIASNLIDYDSIFKEINKTNSLVLYVVDILNLPQNITSIKKTLHNDCILVLNKRDLLPFGVNDDKIIKYLSKEKLGFVDMVITSSEKNAGMDLLLSKIRKYQKDKDVYVVGYTNAGKSSLISKFIKDYGNGEVHLSTSPLPSTTLNKVIIPITDDLVLIDTPGIIDSTTIINYVDRKMFKKLNSKKEIKPKTYQIKGDDALLIGNIVRFNYYGGKNSLTFYIPNEIRICNVSSENKALVDFHKVEMDVEERHDLVISGLGFVKIINSCHVELYLPNGVSVFTRKNMI